MRFSCADFTFPLLPHDRVFALIRLLDLYAVDLGIFAGRSHVQPRDILGDVPGAARTMRESLARHGLGASDVFVQTGAEPAIQAANDPDAAVRAENRRVFLAIVEYAAAIGCEHVTGLPGVRHADVDEAADWELAVEEAVWRRDAAAAYELTYAVEAHVGSILPGVAETLRFVGDAGVTLTLDYGHFVYQGRPASEPDALLPHASHFHARGGCAGQLQSTMKDNVIDFASIVRALEARGYAGYCCLEYVWVDWEGCNRTDNVSETILLRDALRAARKAQERSGKREA